MRQVSEYNVQDVGYPESLETKCTPKDSRVITQLKIYKHIGSKCTPHFKKGAGLPLRTFARRGGREKEFWSAAGSGDLSPNLHSTSTLQLFMPERDPTQPP